MQESLLFLTVQVKGDGANGLLVADGKRLIVVIVLWIPAAKCRREVKKS